MPKYAKRTIFYLLMIAMIITAANLSIWQFNRAEYKSKRIDEMRRKLADAVVKWTGKSGEQWQPVEVFGQFIPPQFILRNRHRNKIKGVEIVNLFQIDKGDTILVNRGFISWDKFSAGVSVSFPLQKISLKGYLYKLDKPFFTVGNPSIDPVAENQEIYQLNLQNIERDLAIHLSDYSLRLYKNTHAFDTNWYIDLSAPDKHRAYALQWIGISIVGVIGMLILWRKRRCEN